jgi:hypothetical protein
MLLHILYLFILVPLEQRNGDMEKGTTGNSQLQYLKHGAG